jgi:predicted membrane channel-forming protein YqfA (hemolysin III family)
MDWSSISQFFNHLQTEQVLATLREWNLGELITNPWFLGAAGVLALVAFFLRWRVFLAVILGAVGFAWLLSYTLDRGTALEAGNNEALLVFVGGGVVLVGIVLYLVFIRSD